MATNDGGWREADGWVMCAAGERAVADPEPRPVLTSPGWSGRERIVPTFRREKRRNLGNHRYVVIPNKCMELV
ncbi:hypothetical protein SAMN05216564_105179 [Halopenitus persicus]|uniref:Uncharacterized protein n=1 Tax=Halopenitus persicus TaxID=1048396 RepID=A0A1H3JXN8_9EURY|nr:hypothetical protein SAMN05216564_105179 [Halopenitus persicus]